MLQLEESVAPAGEEARFSKTNWSFVLSAADLGSPKAKAGLAELCGKYWYPLYAYARRRGHDAPQARALIEAFFAEFIGEGVADSSPTERERFRPYLTDSFRKFMASHRPNGGPAATDNADLPAFDFEAAEVRYALEPVRNVTPDRLLARRWALDVLDRVLSGIRQDAGRKGKTFLFDRMKHCLIGDCTEASYLQVAEELGVGVEAIRISAHRFRKQFRKRLRDEIAQIVAGREGINPEIAYLKSVFDD